MTKQILFLFAVAILLSVSPTADASIFKKKKPAKTTQAEPAKKQTAYEKALKGKTESAKSEFITMHRAEGKLLFEMPVKYFDREMLIASTTSEVSASDFVDVGYKPSGIAHFKFSIRDSVVNFCLINASSVTDDPNIGKALKKTTLNPILYAYPIKAYNADSSAVVFDVTALFTTDVRIFQLFSGNSNPLLKVTPTFKKENTSLGAIKAFDDNLSIKTNVGYSLSISLLGILKIMDDYPFSATVTRSILLLPENKMKPRISDSRVGIFNHSKRKFSLKEDKAESYSVAHRWRIEPKDAEAHKRGELSEPVKPIVFYVDDAFPELWKQPVREAVEVWNKAFEKIGFKNAISAKNFPTKEEDPDFDPDNLKYSCIRYLPSTTANAMGPSWVDPVTGEIINASVLVYGNIVQLLNNWRFIQTAQLDPRVRTKKLPEDVLKESITYVVSHEVGHCLGFMHNMASSASFPVDSLRSATFTQANGTTPCIMDYARFNYIAQPEDKGVRLTPPDLGVYDYFLIKWNYGHLPEYATEWEEQATIENWVDAHAGDPVFRYGRQQMQSRYDPSAIEEDLGDDPQKASDYGVKNLKYILANLESWIADDNDYEHRQALYSQIQTQYYRYLRNVMYNIGGIYLTEVKEGTAGRKHQPVSKSVQKNSLKWLLDQYKTMDWIDNRSLKENTPMRIGGSYIIRDRILKDIKGLADNVTLSAFYSDSPYSIAEFMDDIYNATWSNLLQNKPLTDGDKVLQQSMVDLFCVPFAEKKSVAAALPLPGYAPSVEEIIAYRLDETGLVERYPDVFRQYEDEHGLGSVALMLEDGCGNHSEMENHFGSPGNGFLSKVSVTAIDETNSHLQNLAVKSRNLLKSRIAGASGSTKVHYQSLLIKLNTALKDKI